MRTRAKICGITRTSDIQAAVEAGGDAFGLVFYSSSPRYVYIIQAKNLLKIIIAFRQYVGLIV